MSAYGARTGWDGRDRFGAGAAASRMARLAGAAAVLLAFAAGLAGVLYRNPPSLTIAVGGGVLLCASIALVVARYDLAVSLGFLLLAVVLVEPAPSDALFGLVMLVAVVTGRFRLNRVPRLALGVVVAFLILNVLSLTEVLAWGTATRFFLITLYLGMFSLWVVGYIDRPVRARRLVRAYLFAAVFSALLATAALFLHYPGHLIMIGDGQRAKGLFKDPNVYGPFLVPIALILAEEILSPRLLKLRRSLMLVSFLVLTVGVIFSFSRAAWLNLAVAVVVLVAAVVLRRPDRRAITLVLVLAVGAVSIAGAVVGTGSLSFLKQRAHLQGYDSQRFAAQARGLSAGLSHPFGVGPGQFDVISPVSTHSLYIRTLSEQGVLGLLVTIVLVVGTTVLAAVNMLRGRDTYGISAAALLAAWCGLVVNSFFVDTLHWRFLWLVGALVWAGAMRERTAARHEAAGPGGPAWAPALGNRGRTSFAA